MKKAAIICCILTNIITARSQNAIFKWVTGFGSNAFVYSTVIITDDNGNLYTLGYFQETHDFNPGVGEYELTSNGTFDFFIVKMDPGGNFVWAKSIGGPGEDVAYSMVTDINGNIYISGRFQQTVDFDPGTGTSIRAAASFQDMFICKLDPSGNFLWVVTIPGLPQDCGNFIATDDLGNVYMNGNFEGSVDFDPGPATVVLTGVLDIFILKLDASGNFLWVKQINSGDIDYVFDIAVDNAGNIYTTGDFSNTIDFDPGIGVHSITSKGNYDAYILKLDANGNFQWVARFGDVGIDVGVSIEVDDMGNVYTTGEFNGTVDFDPGVGIYYLANTVGYVAPYILKLDGSGNLIWAKMIDNFYSIVMELEVNKSGDVYITGYFRETIDFDPTIMTDDLVANETDMFLAKYSTDGDFEWSAQVSGPGLDYGLGLAVDEHDNIFTTGIFHSTADFDPGPGTHELTSTGEGDVYILKVGICAKTSDTTITKTTCKNFTLNDRTYTATGTYLQTLINDTGCDSTIILNLTITGTIATDIAKSICQGDSFEGYTMAGKYTDTYTTSNGCDSIRTLTLSIVYKPAPNLGEDLFLCKGDSISLYPGQFDSYTWHDGSRQDRLLVREAGTYSVTVQGACGVASDAIIIKAGPCGVFFPSAFTPNNDGVNDIFTTPARNDFFSSFHLVIYNRWGQKIFESKDPSIGWDGRVKGILQTAETFVWACTFTQRNNGVKDAKRGTVTLLR